jgi:hypothetical protein
MFGVRSFRTRTDAESYAEHTHPGYVRFVGACAVCGRGAAQSVPGRWSIDSDLFGVLEVTRLPDGHPAGDPCGHEAMRWQPVELVPGVYESCGETCRDALGASCSCTCLGANHGANHRIRSLHD